jgi:hypothetical protein
MKKQTDPIFRFTKTSKPFRDGFSGLCPKCGNADGRDDQNYTVCHKHKLRWSNYVRDADHDYPGAYRIVDAMHPLDADELEAHAISRLDTTWKPSLDDLPF